MADLTPQEQSLYGLPVPVTSKFPPPVIAKRSPVPSDTGYPLGQMWIDKVSATAYILVLVAGGIATWIPVLGGGVGVQTINGFLPVLSNFNYTNLGGLTISAAAGVFSAGVNVSSPVLQIIGNAITAQISSAAGASNPLLNGVGHFNNADFTVDANGFVSLLASGTPATDFTMQAGVSPVTPDGLGNVTVSASAVASAGIPAQSFGTGANSYEIQVQRADDFGVSSAANAGLASFNNAHFSVDANGWVSLAGGGLAIDQIAVQATTAPGVSPVDPDGTGLLTINGASVAASAVPVQSRSIALNSLQIEVQRADDFGVSSAANAGLASFNNAHFSVDANGFVSSLNGVAATSFDIDANTAPGTDPVVPTALGVVTIGGAQVAAGTVSSGIRTNSIAANSYRIEVQRSSAQAISSVAQNGICHFDSAQFSVDANGFVQSLASVAFVWQDSGPAALAITNGYFATGAGAYTLPLGTADGQTIEIVDQVGGGVVVTAAGAQTIRVQNVNSSAGGTCTSTQFGDALRLIFRASIGEWQTCPGAGGNWLLA